MTWFLLLMLVGSGIAIVFLTVHSATLQKSVDELESGLATRTSQHENDVKQWSEYCARLKAEVERLARWSTVADAEAKAAEMTRTAQAILKKANQDAQSHLAKAQERARAFLAETEGKAKGMVAVAREEVEAQKREAQLVIDTAATEAAKMIEAAQAKAEEIAGSAYEAMRNVATYERAVKAMKNIIEGYGSEYIIPEESLLDGLAEDFGHVEAGRELKAARERTKAMVRDCTAGACAYVEAGRREYAVNFVVDAFNGKVDSILSRAKEDNAGKLAQEIRDAFVLVNLNGKAFRDARITDEYLESRLAELKWASVAQQLKVAEREEQRQIKERLRDEEKARKEYERAIREAAKEEETLRKAMEKARKQIEDATAEQKARYEQQLQELSEKLKEAEERNQRAVSMAQQTKQGHVYVISNIGSFGEDVYKIGLTRRLQPLDRVRELGDSSVPFEFDVHALIFSENAPALEHQLHKHFVLMQMNKVNHRKEFFRVNLCNIREELEKLGLQAKWTMAAEAREYRETLAIERTIKDNPAKREAWMKRQLELEVETDDLAELVGVADEEE
jgi:hypothetical protein